MDKIERYSVRPHWSLQQAMQKIEAIGIGSALVTDESCHLVGVLSDGDIRRALLSENDLSVKVEDVMNRDFVFFNQSDDADTKAIALSRLKIVPVCDDNKTVIEIVLSEHFSQIPIMKPSIGHRERANLMDAIDTGWISSQGRFVKEFEYQFATYHDREALAVSNGTVALELALRALGIGPGDEVIVPNLTFAATINAVIHVGAAPIICDIEQDSWGLNNTKLEELIGLNTKCVIAVHLYGAPCKIQKIKEICEKYNLWLVEDCAEAIGSRVDGKLVGKFGDAAAFSFFGNKTLTTGEGGMVITPHNKVYDRAILLRDHGMSAEKRYWHEIVGFNFRMTNLQAAIGVAQFERLEEILSRKLYLADRYTRGLVSRNIQPKLQILGPFDVNTHWLYSLLLKTECDRELLVSNLTTIGIDCRRFFFPLNVMPPYQRFKTSRSLEVSEQVSRCGVSLPSFLDMDDSQIDWIVASMASVEEIDW